MAGFSLVIRFIFFGNSDKMNGFTHKKGYRFYRV